MGYVNNFVEYRMRTIYRSTVHLFLLQRVFSFVKIYKRMNK